MSEYRGESRKKNKEPMRITRRMSKKLIILFLLFFIVIMGLNIRLSFITWVKGENYALQVLAQRNYNSVAVPFKRGDILDRNQTTLATSIKTYNLILDPKIILKDKKYLEHTLKALEKYFDFERADLQAEINDNQDSSYVIYKKNLIYDEIKDFIENQNKSDYIKGVWFEHEYKRNYPFDTLACNVIGHTDKDNVGRWGVEEFYNNYLHGTDGREYSYINEGNMLERVIKEAENGYNIVSTIDMNIQMIIERHIKEYKKTYKPQRVAVVLANPNNGEILAMASDKVYNLNKPRDLTYNYSKKKINQMTEKQTVNALNKQWRNYCISDTYEPGSTIKPYTVISALEEDKIQLTDSYTCNGNKVVGGWPINCHKRDGHGIVTPAESVMHSCNVALMDIADKLGANLFIEYQNRFNFGMRTGIDLPGEASAAGLLHDADTMNSSSLATNSFGQNFNVTMVQMVASFSSSINGGYYYEPRVVKQILNEKGGVVENMRPKLVKQTIAKDTSEFIRDALHQVTISGTGKSAVVPGYKVGGKTGTAQKLDKDKDEYLLSFLGFAPLDNPQVVCYVIVDDPKVDDNSSSSYASRLFSSIMAEVLPYMNIFRTEEIIPEPPTGPTGNTPGDNQTGEEPGGQTGEEPGGQTGEEPGGQTGEEPGGQTGEEPGGGQTGEEPGGQTGEEPGGQTGEEPGGQTGGEPGGQTGEEPNVPGSSDTDENHEGSRPIEMPQGEN